jgi:hypothetical protein
VGDKKFDLPPIVTLAIQEIEKRGKILGIFRNEVKYCRFGNGRNWKNIRYFFFPVIIYVIHVLLRKSKSNRGFKEGFRCRSIIIWELKDCIIYIIDEEVDLSGVGIHNICALLKLYLRELPEPVISYDLYDDILKVMVETPKGCEYICMNV